MKRIEVGEEIYIIRKSDQLKEKGEISQISDSSLIINNVEYNFSDIKTIGASRRDNGFVTAVISGVSFTVFFTGYILSLASLSYLSNSNTMNSSSFNDFLMIISIFAMLFFVFLSIFIGQLFAFSSLFYFYNQYYKKTYLLEEWRLETVKGEPKQNDWKRLKNFIELK